MSHMLVRFNEDGHWLKGKILFYPNSIKTRAEPGPNWKSYSVTTMSTPCVPVQNQSRKRNKEVCTDESEHEDFNVFPSKKVS